MCQHDKSTSGLCQDDKGTSDMCQRDKGASGMCLFQLDCFFSDVLHYCWCVFSGYLEIAELLIQGRADINQVCEYQERGVTHPQKYTALMFAVKQGN